MIIIVMMAAVRIKWENTLSLLCNDYLLHTFLFFAKVFIILSA